MSALGSLSFVYDGIPDMTPWLRPLPTNNLFDLNEAITRPLSTELKKK